MTTQPDLWAWATKPLPDKLPDDSPVEGCTRPDTPALSLSARGPPAARTRRVRDEEVAGGSPGKIVRPGADYIYDSRVLARLPSTTLLASPSFRALALALLGLWGAYQCLWNPAGQNIAGDEHIYVTAGWQYIHGDFAHNLEHPPTAKYIFGIAQLAAGQGTLGPRLVVGVMVLAGGVILLLWLRAAIGWWAGLAAAALWWVAPRGGASFRVDRLAMLDPVMTFFALAALAAAWMWMHSGRLWWVPVSAALMALSVTSKVSTLVMLPAFLVLPLLYRRPKSLIVGGLVWIATFGIVVIALYAPVGMVNAISYMLEFQSAHNASGHSMTISGHVYEFAPWWANLWFMMRGLGPVVLVVVAAGVIAALVIHPDRLVAYLGIVVILLAIFYMGVSKVALGGYYYAFMPFLIALCGIGYGRLSEVRPRVVTATVTLVAFVAAATPSVNLSRTIWEVEPSGIARVPAVLETHGIGAKEKVLFVGCPSSVYHPYMDGRGTSDLKRGPFAAVVQGKDPRGTSAEPLRKLISDQPEQFQQFRAGNLVVWIPSGQIVVDKGSFAVR